MSLDFNIDKDSDYYNYLIDEEGWDLFDSRPDPDDYLPIDDDDNWDEDDDEIDYVEELFNPDNYR